MKILAMIDDLSERLEQAGHRAIAAVLDTVSQELLQRENEYECPDGTCADGTCADANGMCRDGTAAVQQPAAANTAAPKPPQKRGVKGSFARFPRTNPLDKQPTEVLTEKAPQVFEAVKQYGARAYAVDGNGMEVAIERGDVETTAEFQFHSRDEVGNPQLRITFECGGEKMVRWASLKRFDEQSIVDAVVHVFSTGNDYGDGVVTAAKKNERLARFISPPKRIPNKRLELVDTIEQRVHDACIVKASTVEQALNPFSKRALREVASLLDRWTARHVTRYLRAS